METFNVLKHFVPFLGIIYEDKVGFPNEKAISKELVQDLDFDEDWAWSAAALIMHYRRMNAKDVFMRMLERGVDIKLSEDLNVVVKDHMDKYPVVGINDERVVMLLKIDNFTTNDMFMK